MGALLPPRFALIPRCATRGLSPSMSPPPALTDTSISPDHLTTPTPHCGDRPLSARTGPSPRALGFPQSRHWNDLSGQGRARAEIGRTLAGKLQLPLNRLGARLLAQWVRERVERNRTAAGDKSRIEASAAARSAGRWMPLFMLPPPE